MNQEGGLITNWAEGLGNVLRHCGRRGGEVGVGGGGGAVCCVLLVLEKRAWPGAELPFASLRSRSLSLSSSLQASGMESEYLHGCCPAAESAGVHTHALGWRRRGVAPGPSYGLHCQPAPPGRINYLLIYSLFFGPQNQGSIAWTRTYGNCMCTYIPPC